MKKNLLRFFAFNVLFVFISEFKAQTICNPSGNLVIFSNYDGGDLNIDVDVNVPNLKIGICSYEAVKVTISGAFAGNVTQVIYAGYNNSPNTNCSPNVNTTTVMGVPAGIVSINFAPPTGYNNVNGYGFMICGYSCNTTSSQGGCNTVDQIASYFIQQTSGIMRSHFVQYGCWAGTTKTISGGGNCCALPCTAPSAPTNTTAAAQQVICANMTTTLGAVATGTVTWHTTATSTPVLGTGTAYVTPTLSAAGTYTYYAQTTNSCGVSATRTPVTVTVNPLPIVTVNTGSLCSGDSFTMTPGGATSYTFSNGSAIVTPTTNTTPSVVASYTVTGANAQGCTNSAVLSLTVYALPNVSVTPASTNACVNNGVSLTGSPSGGLYSGTNVSGGVFTSNTTGTFTPMYSYTASITGCSNTASTSIVVSPCTAIEAYGKAATAVSIHPNPNAGEFIVELANGIEKNIRITDINGKLVYSTTSSQDKIQINVTLFANGIYYVQVQSGNTDEVIKVMKR